MARGPLVRHLIDVVVVTTAMKHPVRTSPTSFEPGDLRGQGFVYDFEQHRVRCAGNVHVTSSPSIEYSYYETAMRAALDRGPRLSASLDADLDRQLRQAIVDGALLKL
jgi:hypothetical protein